MTDKSLAQIMYEAYWLEIGTAGYPWDRLPQAARECWERCEQAVLNSRLIFKDPCVQKCEPGEPFFVLLGRDPDAQQALAEWIRWRTDREGESLKINAARNTLDRFRVYCSENGDPNVLDAENCPPGNGN